MNPLSPHLRALLKQVDTAQETQIPQSDTPRTTARADEAAAAAPEATASLALAAAVTPQEPVSIGAPAPADGPEVIGLPPEEEMLFPAAEISTPSPVSEPPSLQPHTQAVAPDPFPTPVSDHEPSLSAHDDDLPPLRDEDDAAPMDHDVPMNLGDIMASDDSPLMPMDDGPIPGGMSFKSSSAPPPLAPGARPFPPNLELNRWYRLLTDEADRPIAIMDHARGKAVYTYPSPPDKLSFKINLASMVAGASAMYRAPLRVMEMTEKMEGKKFCFESQPGDEGSQIVLKLADAGDAPGTKVETLPGKVFKPSPMSSMPAMASSAGVSMPTPSMASSGKNTILENVLWMEDYRARRRGMRG
jgi:hypothetical protein